MPRCILKLLDEPAEEDIESALTTVRSALSGPKGKELMDLYFETMKELVTDHAISSRIRFTYRGVIGLGARDWIPRNQTTAPTTLAEVHEAAAKAKETAPRPFPMSLNSPRRGSNRGGGNSLEECPTDGWNSARSLGRAAASTLTVNSTVLPPKHDNSASRTPALPRSASSNMFHSLARNASDSDSNHTIHALTRKCIRPAPHATI